MGGTHLRADGHGTEARRLGRLAHVRAHLIPYRVYLQRDALRDLLSAGIVVDRVAALVDDQEGRPPHVELHQRCRS